MPLDNIIAPEPKWQELHDPNALYPPYRMGYWECPEGWKVDIASTFSVNHPKCVSDKPTGSEPRGWRGPGSQSRVCNRHPS